MHFYEILLHADDPDSPGGGEFFVWTKAANMQMAAEHAQGIVARFQCAVSASVKSITRED